MEEANKYIDQLLEIIKDEVNVKEVIIGRNGTMLFNGDILHDMQAVRDVCKEGLKQRAEAKIKVRQPLQSLTIGY